VSNHCKLSISKIGSELLTGKMLQVEAVFFFADEVLSIASVLLPRNHQKETDKTECLVRLNSNFRKFVTQ
jgi:hypothetical protein